eukprot:m.135582 g.135582  ORF g.135582 m.135582 type:complete len:163 (-) comp13979_c2_seq1:2364-2852(-)
MDLEQQYCGDEAVRDGRPSCDDMAVYEERLCAFTQEQAQLLSAVQKENETTLKQLQTARLLRIKLARHLAERRREYHKLAVEYQTALVALEDIRFERMLVDKCTSVQRQCTLAATAQQWEHVHKKLQIESKRIGAQAKRLVKRGQKTRRLSEQVYKTNTSST